MDPRRLLMLAAAGLALSGCALLPPPVRIAADSPAAPVAETRPAPETEAGGAGLPSDGIGPSRFAPAAAATAEDGVSRARPYLEVIAAGGPPAGRGAASATGRPAIAAANTAARARSTEDRFVGGVQIFGWSPGRVFEVWAAPLRVTTLSLAPGETLVSKAAGDTVRWQIGEAASGSGEGRITHVLLKPLERGLETNLILTTNRRVYLIDLKSGGADAFNAAIAWDAGSVTGASSPVVAQSEGPEPPTPDRVRKSVVQTIVIAGAVLVSGSLAWAFVVQPELRANARDRQAEAREDQARGVVRPTDAVTDQPANYDRLPSPRGASPLDDAEAGPAAPPTSEARAPGYASSAHARSPYAPAERAPGPPRAGGPSPRELAARSGLFFAGAPGSSTAPPVPARGEGAAFRAAGADLGADFGEIYNGHGLVAPLSPFELKAGALVPAALLTAVDTARAGPVIATVTQNVFDTVSGRHLLIPQGARLIGRSEGESAYGDRRAFLTWERLILPNGKSLILTSEAGVDAQGAIGVRGQVDRRLLPLLVGTLFAGAITTLGQVARDGSDGGGLLGDAGDAAAIEGARVGGRLIDRELQVRPSIRLRAGAPVRVLITRDLILEPYRP